MQMKMKDKEAIHQFIIVFLKRSLLHTQRIVKVEITTKTNI